MELKITAGKLHQQSDIQMIAKDYLPGQMQEDWSIKAYSEFNNILNNGHFPCLFGRHAFKNTSLIFTFVTQQNPQSDLINSMMNYTKFVRDVPVKQRLYSPLVLFFEKQDFQCLAQEHAFAWSQLQMIHDNDPANWPDNIPSEPDNHLWSFCFNGIELFINISCPHHLKLKSRNLGNHIVFIINPRKNFDILASNQDEKGIKVRERIRNRVCNYNNGIVPDELGFFGSSHNYEWRQYQLNEPGDTVLQRCPLVIKPKKNNEEIA
ncbi:YqcI/YcgG family protein [Pectobacteriaceae bacterium C52]|nr:YqcI/YcgG family protein [Pectobacteriaceae bacterium C52]